jgi:hypothetical protein
VITQGKRWERQNLETKTKGIRGGKKERKKKEKGRKGEPREKKFHTVGSNHIQPSLLAAFFYLSLFLSPLPLFLVCV